VPQINPFQSLKLDPFPIDPTHNTLFTSPFALPFHPFIVSRSASLPIPTSLPLSPTSGGMVRVVGGGGGRRGKGKF
jgi:hypothetical protein